MNLTIFRKPSVTTIARPQFQEPEHLRVSWSGEATDGERLAEYAGRLCYMSQHNPAKRSTAEYLTNILQQAHGSVAEHANYSLLIEGVSRSLTHELIRHRAGFAYSQLSQRFVDESDAAFVLPPAFDGNQAMEDLFAADCIEALKSYSRNVELMMEQYADIPNLVERRKSAREAARSVLPNCTETKLVVTGNVRAWRHFLTMRGHKAADKEIRRLALVVHQVLLVEAPAFFSDFYLHEGSLVPQFVKV